MNATITTNHGTYTGRSVETIVRREYGHNARVLWSRDASAPHAGTIVKPAGEASFVLANLISYDGRSDTIDQAKIESAADRKFLASIEGQMALTAADAEWATWDAMHEDQN